MSSPGVVLHFDFLSASVELSAYGLSDGRGFVPGGCWSAPSTQELTRMVAHWVNLPSLGGRTVLRENHRDGRLQEWAGRWRLDLAGWRVTIDERPDLRDVYRDAERAHLHVPTHTMEVVRADQATFTCSEVDDFLMGLQFAFGFSLGRWAAPVLAVAFDSAGKLGWSEWAPLHLDSPARDSGKWWVEHRPQDLRTFLTCFMNHWSDPAERQTLKFLVTSALAAGERSFVEQRLMTSLAGIEHLSWATEVQAGQMAEQQWRRAGAPRRIRRLLSAARVPSGLNPMHTPSLAVFAEGCGHVDGPAALCAVRDSVTHPKDTIHIYELPGLVAEASRLSAQYLNLLILRHLGFVGHVSDRTKVTGWVGECEPVPWAAASKP